MILFPGLFMASYENSVMKIFLAQMASYDFFSLGGLETTFQL